MEAIKNEQIYAFDSLYTTNHIQMLKILLPCLNPPLQKNLALYIKFLELRYTISFLRSHPYVISGCGFDKEHRGQDISLNDLLPYLTPKEAENFRQLQKSMDMMKQFSSMQKNMEALKDILPEGMDLETLFGQIVNNPFPKADGAEGSFSSENTDKSDSRRADGDAGIKNPAGGLLQNMIKGTSSGDILKNMMSDSQMDLYQKFNERFENL